jgi:hypothetical protein
MHLVEPASVFGNSIGIALMSCSSRPSPTTETRLGRRLARAIAIAFALGLVIAAMSPPAQAQLAFVPAATPPPPPPSPAPLPTDVSSELSAAAAVTNLGSNFLERLGSQATYGFGRALRNNPGGGGASEAAEGPQFRAWGEGYGISATTGAQGVYVGDHRQTWGGVAGIGARVAPGVNVGFSVDQSRTSIDVPLALQSATVDLTQLGFNA